MEQSASEEWIEDLPGNEYRMADYDERGKRAMRVCLPPEIEPYSSEFIAYMRSLSGAERFALGQRMTDYFFTEVENEIRAEHPDFDDVQVRIEMVMRMYGPTLGERYRRYVASRNVPNS